MARRHLFTSESVSEGHPDKIADRISDTVLDAFIAKDPDARVACETLIADNLVVITGEFRTSDRQLFEAVRSSADALARREIHEIGYRDADTGIDPDNCEILVRFNHQSPQIAQGVDRPDGVTGAGDQGLVFGYACDETPELLPYPIWLAHRLVQRQAALRKAGSIPWLLPDAKSQVTAVYEQGRVVGIDTVVLSTQHAAGIDQREIRETVVRDIIAPLVPDSLRGSDFRILINPAGSFEIGGPKGDTGLTGRKIIVDSYGGSCPHGGGAFSGKDPSKVDRSAAYAARLVAKNIVAAGLAGRCTVQVAYAIGVAEPVSLLVDTHGTGKVADDRLEKAVSEVFDLTPGGIIDRLQLKRPIFKATSAYGHFGRNEADFTWEKTDRIDTILTSIG